MPPTHPFPLLSSLCFVSQGSVDGWMGKLLFVPPPRVPPDVSCRRGPTAAGGVGLSSKTTTSTMMRGGPAFASRALLHHSEGGEQDDDEDEEGRSHYCGGMRLLTADGVLMPRTCYTTTLNVEVSTLDPVAAAGPRGATRGSSSSSRRQGRWVPAEDRSSAG